MCKHIFLLIFVQFVFSIACSGSGQYEYALKGDVMTEQGELADSNASYLLVSGDTIDVAVFTHNEFNINQRIDANGNVSMPLVGEISVFGMTLREAESKIAKLLISERLLAKPQVKVSIVNYSLKEIVILGQVKSPGSVAFPAEANHMRLIDVISKAGGLTRISKDSAIRITHTNEAGKEEVQVVDISSMMSSDKRNKSGIKKQILVYPNDVVYVPERIF